MITVFLLTSVVLLMVISLLALARRDSFQTKTQLDRVAARLVAEAGLSHAMQQLSADPEWIDGFAATFGWTEGFPSPCSSRFSQETTRWKFADRCG